MLYNSICKVREREKSKEKVLTISKVGGNPSAVRLSISFLKLTKISLTNCSKRIYKKSIDNYKEI